MTAKQNTIEVLRESVTKSLSDIVSLKQTCSQQENTITELNKKNSELALENETSRVEMNDLKVKISNQSDQINKLEGEKTDLKTAMKKLESFQKKSKKTALQD